jgi:hypothetical protein
MLPMKPKQPPTAHRNTMIAPGAATPSAVRAVGVHVPRRRSLSRPPISAPTAAIPATLKASKPTASSSAGGRRQIVM